MFLLDNELENRYFPYKKHLHLLIPISYGLSTKKLNVKIIIFLIYSKSNIYNFMITRKTTIFHYLFVSSIKKEKKESFWC